MHLDEMRIEVASFAELGETTHLMFLSRKPSSGFTLTEVMVAISIFTMVIAGGLSGIRRGFDILQDSRNFTRISQILQSEVESLRSLSWGELNALSTNESLSLSSEFDEWVYDRYTVRRRIESVDTNLRQVVITVSYENDRGRLMTFRYYVFFTEGGGGDYSYRTI